MNTRKERLFYLDFIRAIAAVSIVITHFNARYSAHIPEIKGRMIGLEKNREYRKWRMGSLIIFYNFRGSIDVCL